MSVLLSIQILPYFASTYGKYKALQIGGFRDSRNVGMVFGSATVFQNSQDPVGIESCGADGFEKDFWADVVRARAGHENSPGPQHLERAQVQFLISAKGGSQISLGFRERGRVEHDAVIFLS